MPALALERATCRDTVTSARLRTWARATTPLSDWRADGHRDPLQGRGCIRRSTEAIGESIRPLFAHRADDLCCGACFMSAHDMPDAAQLAQTRPVTAEDRAQEFGQREHVLPMRQEARQGPSPSLARARSARLRAAVYSMRGPRRPRLRLRPPAARARERVSGFFAVLRAQDLCRRHH